MKSQLQRRWVQAVSRGRRESPGEKKCLQSGLKNSNRVTINDSLVSSRQPEQSIGKHASQKSSLLEVDTVS